MKRKLACIALLILSFSLQSCVYFMIKEIEQIEYFSASNLDTNYNYDNIVNVEALIEAMAKDTVGILAGNSAGKRDTPTVGNDSTVTANGYAATVGEQTAEKQAATAEKAVENEQSKYEIEANITTINSNYYPDSVIINAIVFDNRGNFISGLAAPYLDSGRTYKDFWKPIIDSCKNEKHIIENFTVEEIREQTSPPFSICFVLDHSSSMGEQRTVALQQATRFSISKIKDGDYLSAIKFTNKPTVEVLPTNDKEIFKQQFLINGMSPVKYGMGTDILLALDSAIEVLKTIDSQYNRIVILFTDGESSQRNYNRIVKKAKDNNIRVFTICYGMGNKFSFMERLAKDTDGKFFYLKTVREFAKAFQYIYNTLTNYYKITYKPPLCDDLHNVKLELQLQGLGFDNIATNGQYDKSIFTDFVDIGTVTLVDIEFEYNKSTISKESLEMLVDIAEQLKRNEQVKIQIGGHTDDIGGDDFNTQLSLARANSVRDELVKLGIAKKRLTVRGFGKTKPIVPNDSEENRKKNRRTEFTVVE